jgi:uncharacterized phage protein gp47/JayE
MVRDDVTAALDGAVLIGNSVLRVISDAQAGLAHLVLRYIDWETKQLLPDTAEDEWLERHANIWLVNADGSVGRKGATLAYGTVTMSGTAGVIIPSGTILGYSTDLQYETTEQITLGATATTVPVRATTAGTIGNRLAGDTLSLPSSILGIADDATVVDIDNGVDQESIDDLRARVLLRIQQPPMGGDANDYVIWATAVAGVTRAWVSTEMGVGTVTVRFMMDDLRLAQEGIPLQSDILTVTDYIDTVRPVALKDRWVLAPVPEPIDFRIVNLSNDTPSVRAGIETAVRAMLREKAAPAHIINGIMQSAEMIYAAWVSEAISSVAGVENFTLVMDDHEMPYPGSIAVLGTIIYDID